jgi:hypothetical protein
MSVTERSSRRDHPLRLETRVPTITAKGNYIVANLRRKPPSERCRARAVVRID